MQRTDKQLLNMVLTSEKKIFMPCKTADTDIPFGKRYNEMDRRRRAGPGRLAEERGPGCSDGAVQNKKQDACVWRGR